MFVDVGCVALQPAGTTVPGGVLQGEESQQSTRYVLYTPRLSLLHFNIIGIENNEIIMLCIVKVYSTWIMIGVYTCLNLVAFVYVA